MIQLSLFLDSVPLSSGQKHSTSLSSLTEQLADPHPPLLTSQTAVNSGSMMVTGHSYEYHRAFM